MYWASRANCQQRAGRAGRVMSGRVYRLVSRYFYNTLMSEFGIPEMLRCSLERLILKTKLCDMGSPSNILGLALNPPNLTNIKNTILILKEIGALYTYMEDGTYDTEDGEITYLGRIMAALPIDVYLSRLIMLGYMFSVLHEAVVMAASLSVRSIFIVFPERDENDTDLYIQKLTWADGSGSDLIALLRAYETWKRLCSSQSLTTEEEKYWTRHYKLNMQSLREMDLLVEEIKKRLENFNIKIDDIKHRVHWLDREKPIILKILIAGAFYPNYFTCSSLNNVDNERSINIKLHNNDPCRTVYFTGFHSNDFGYLYVNAIKEYFSRVNINPHDIEVRFKPNSEHVFVIFTPQPDQKYMVPGRVCFEVYKALRMRISKIKLFLRVME